MVGRFTFGAIPGLIERLDAQFDSHKHTNRILETMAATLADILAAVQHETTVEASAVALIQQLVSDIQAANNANDQATINQILALAQTNISTLADAVVKNTPAAPATPAQEPAQPAATDTPAEPTA